MKKLTKILALCFLTTICFSQTSRIDITVAFETAAPASFAPSSVFDYNLVARGFDSIAIWANGVSLGQKRWPYQVRFTTASSGPNTVIVVGTNYFGNAVTNTLSIPESFDSSTPRPIKIKRLKRF